MSQKKYDIFLNHFWGANGTNFVMLWINFRKMKEQNHWGGVV